MKLLAKGILLAAIPTFFELVALGFLLDAQHQTATADAWAAHSADVLDSLSAIQIPVLKEAVRFRGSLLSQVPQPSDPALWELLDKQALRLIDLVTDNPSQQQRMRMLRADLVNLRESQAPLSAQALNDPDALHAAYRTGLGGDALRRINELLTAAMHEEQRLDTQRRQAVAKAREQQKWALYITFLLSLVLATIAVWLYERSIGPRLSTLTRNAEHLGRGERLEPLVAGNDEITLVDRALHSASEEIERRGREQARAERELAERAEALANANADLRQQRADNDMFIYSVSHDLRSPLVNLEGFSKELVYNAKEIREELADVEMPDSKRAAILSIMDREFEPSLRYVSAAVAQSSKIIDALLKLSRVGRIELREEVIDVDRLVHSLIDAAAATVRKNETRFEIGELPPLMGDLAAISQVFANLINNAIHYRSPERPSLITISGHALAADVIYVVSDNGLGMTEAQVSKLFVAFKRFHPDVAQGEGIGLAYVRRVVERHSGRIAVTSTPGEGTTFTLTFPNRAVRET